MVNKIWNLYHISQRNALVSENKNGYVFKSIETLVSEEISEIPFIWTFTVDDEYEGEYHPIKSYEVKKSFNIMENQLSHMYASRLVTHDIVKRETSTFDFDYVEDFELYKHIEPNKSSLGQGITMLYPKDGVRHHNGINYNDNYDSNLNLIPKHFRSYSKSGDSSPYSSYEEKTIQVRKSQLQQLENLRLDIVVGGNIGLQVGNVIEVQIPSPQPINKNIVLDSYLSGKFLITALKHTFNSDNFNTLLELKKDTYKSPIDYNSDLENNIQKGMR